MIKSLALSALAVSALALSACDGPVHLGPPKGAKSAVKLRVIDKLTCPAVQGELKLISAAADGLSCAYAAPDAEVALRLIALNGGEASAVLAPIEADLKALTPDVKAPALSAADGSKADIHLPGVSIKAGDQGAKIRVGGVNIQADHDTAEVRFAENVTVSGNDSSASSVASSEQRHTASGDIRATFVLASDRASAGYHMVGYEARGPAGGPIVVGIVKAKERKGGDHDILQDVKALLKTNVGGGHPSITVD